MTDRTPNWTLNVKVNDEGITQASFTVDTYSPEPDVEAAMRHLAKVALWWIDTKQFDSMGITGGGDD